MGLPKQGVIFYLDLLGGVGHHSIVLVYLMRLSSWTWVSWHSVRSWYIWYQPTNDSHIGCDWQALPTQFTMMLAVMPKLTSSTGNVGSRPTMQCRGTFTKYSRVSFIKNVLIKVILTVAYLCCCRKMSSNSSFNLRSILENCSQARKERVRSWYALPGWGSEFHAQH